KHFEAGSTYHTILFGRRKVQEIQKALAEYRTTTDDAARIAALQKVDDRMKAAQTGTLGATFVDFAGKLEGEATKFNVTNFRGDGIVQLDSRTLKLFGSRKGFWKFRLLPGGVEGGRSLRKGDESAMTTKPRKNNRWARSNTEPELCWRAAARVAHHQWPYCSRNTFF